MSPSKTQIIKSNTCKSNYGEFLSEYNTKYNAKEHSQYLKLDHDSELTPYKCNTCKKWHLSPKNRHTPSIICTTCTDGNKKPKELYFTKKGAQIRKTIILKEQKIKLKIYKCPNGDGWHLTKGNIK
ncbi:MAG: hypothetical protein H8E60_01790 [Candidatus Marinimicrobia bacterium]|nr:hypothetical protein [Candidatus Neomarinimicrobiota bacterium]